MPLLAAYMVPHPPLIIPDIGKGEEKKIESTILAYQKIAKEISELKPDTIIISSPHAPSYYDYNQLSNSNSMRGDFNNFRSALKMEKSVDGEFVKELNSLFASIHFPSGSQGKQDGILDHGTMIPLFFINKYYQDYKIVRVSISGLSLDYHAKLGDFINKAILSTNKNVVYIASGDLSHKLMKEGPYGYAKEGPEFDKKIIEIINNHNLDELLNFKDDYLNKAAECGLRSFAILSGVLKNYQYQADLLSYEGPFGVGYLCSKFTILSPKEKPLRIMTNPYVSLAKRSIEYFLRKKRKLEVPSDLPKEMLNNQAGIFVSIHKHGYLRGCIGTFLPTTPSIAEEVIQNAISAATKDPRFPVIQINEIDSLDISVDILSKPEQISGISQLDPQKFGVIVKHRNRSGLLLPMLEGVDTVEEQLNIALNKAGISSDEPYTIERFKVIRYH